MKSKSLKVVEVLWEDACSADPWSHDATLLDEYMAITVGILIHQDKKGIHLASAISSEDQRAGRWRIPAGMIRKVRVLGTLKTLKGIK